MFLLSEGTKDFLSLEKKSLTDFSRINLNIGCFGSVISGTQWVFSTFRFVFKIQELWKKNHSSGYCLIDCFGFSSLGIPIIHMLDLLCKSLRFVIYHERSFKMKSALIREPPTHISCFTPWYTMNFWHSSFANWPPPGTHPSTLDWNRDDVTLVS